MVSLVGFLIALGVGLTGVGAGAVTAPVLILFFGLSPAASVGTSLAFAAVIKLAVAPIYLLRRQVNLGILLKLCIGGIPGVVAGVYIVSELNAKRHEKTLLILVGLTVAALALYSLWRSVRKNAPPVGKDRSNWLPAIAAGIGAEVGISSAGAGALGSLALLNLTTLTPAQVVGTDMLFGLALALIGGGFHVTAGHYDSAILVKLLIGGIAGAIVGANLVAVLPPRPLRIGLAVCLSFLGVQLLLKGMF
jgi:uncharacterized membrane protein YfcA